MGWVGLLQLLFTPKPPHGYDDLMPNFATSAVSLCLDAGPNNPEFHALATAMERPFLNTKFSFRAIS